MWFCPALAHKVWNSGWFLAVMWFRLICIWALSGLGIRKVKEIFIFTLSAECPSLWILADLDPSFLSWCRSLISPLPVKAIFLFCWWQQLWMQSQGAIQSDKLPAAKGVLLWVVLDKVWGFCHQQHAHGNRNERLSTYTFIWDVFVDKSIDRDI